MKTSKTQFTVLSNQESGFTLIESLMAIVVLTIMLVGVAPMIFLSTATRVQARRVERATQAARTYVDGIRAGSILPPNAVVPINERLITNQGQPTERREFNPQRGGPTASTGGFSQVPAPNMTLPNCDRPATLPTTPSPTNYPYCANPTQPAQASATVVSLYCVDLDANINTTPPVIPGCRSDSNSDLIIQAYRSVSRIPTNAEEQRQQIDRGYLLGIRVYRADAFRETTPPLLSNRENQARQRTSGASFNRKAPLLELTTEITRPTTPEEKGTRFQDFCERLGGCNN
ncbi:hormogonium polysaccharide secretion pseudopilin HpsB [Geitlerinema splendidum]|nr:hormogonium polysaccharide secretion pseudopilin HpsB [Geitlerinema splendidum]